MYFESLDSITEEKLAALEREQVAENLTLEFKGSADVDLDNERHKRESAKDASAFANAAGGQILYGISEKELGDGTKVAGPIAPLTAGDIDERLASIWASAIHPPLRPRTRRIDVKGGYVLAVEIARSPLDLHMVTAYNEKRFYKRGEKAAIPMTEPEIREAYARIGTLRVSLEERIERLVRPEITGSPLAHSWIVIAPWFSTRHLLDPQLLGDVGRDLGAHLGNRAGAFRFNDLRLEAEGFRDTIPPKAPRNEVGYSLAILRSGLIYLADSFERNPNPLTSPGAENSMVMSSFVLLARLAEMIIAAQYVYDKVKYWGEVRVEVILRPPVQLFIDRESRLGSDTLPAGEYRLGPVDVSLRRVGKKLGPVAKPIMDQLFQTRGVPRSPYFDDDGCLLDRHARNLSLPEVAAYLT